MIVYSQEFPNILVKCMVQSSLGSSHCKASSPNLPYSQPHPPRPGSPPSRHKPPLARHIAQHRGTERENGSHQSGGRPGRSGCSCCRRGRCRTHGTHHRARWCTHSQGTWQIKGGDFKFTGKIGEPHRGCGVCVWGGGAH